MTDKEIIEAFIGCCISHRLECEDCIYGNRLDCLSDLYADIIALVDRQQDEIKELNVEIDKQYELAVADIKGNLANGGVSCHWCIEQNKAEAIRDFAEKFDDVLVELRDEYAHNGRPEYGLVCEVVHHKLLKTVKETVGTENET